MISVNDIIKEVSTEVKFRVLWLSPDNKTAFIIQLEAANALPTKVDLYEIQAQLSDGVLTVATDDLSSYFASDYIPSEQNLLFRENLWSQLGDMLSNEPGIYDRTTRGKLVNEALETTGLCKATIYKHLRRYWQRGKNKNALMPDIANAGGKGTKKKSTQKLGRPQKYGDIAGKYIDDATEAIFEIAVKKYYHTRHQYTFKAAYEAMVKEFYSVEATDGEGKTKRMLLPPEQIPTINQFRYWYKKTYTLQETLRTRKGDNTYNLKHRAITGKSDTEIMGPGAKYQIDSTVGDIYLVSRFNRADIIGRPIIYFVIDVFSRMVVGVYVGLEGPSWLGAMMALANAASDKVKFCVEYDIEITNADWPCRHIPEVFLSDRGEMESKSVEALINTLGVRIENAAPYRADMKGIVEQYFHTVDTTVTAFLPGHVKPDMSQRGGRDYRLDAQLDLRQFTEIIIECILYYNNNHLLESFERSEDMIRDGVQPIPIKLWEWGIANRSGLLRSFPEDIVKLCLLPVAKATVTAKGIRFKGIYYLSDFAIRENWFEKARAKGSFRVDISYDPRDMGFIYLRNTGNSPYEVCYLADWQDKYNKKYLDEIIYLQESEKMEKRGYFPKKLEARINLSAKVDKIVSKAAEEAKQTPIPKSKIKRTGNIRANRELEKEKIRSDEAFQLDGAISLDKEIASPLNDEEDLLYLDLIKKNAEERRHD